jgi:hypothetical protein
MAEKLTDHPLVLYLSFVMPVALLIMGIIARVNVMFLILAAAWLGVSLILLFLPIATDNGAGS